MDRTDFIKTIGLGGATLFLPNPGIICQPVKIHDNYLRGLAHYGWNKAQSRLHEGAILQLVREAQNLHDSFAIQVWQHEIMLGYIPAYENVALANMIDAGVRLEAMVSLFQPSRSIHERLAVAIYADLIQADPHLVSSSTKSRSDDAHDLYRSR